MRIEDRQAELVHATKAPERRFWQAVAKRDGRYDGAFVFAVRSTGIYCRPSCPARRPRRQQVKFFRVPEVRRLPALSPL
jgi:AraC family transcriptional regulator of adaptative response/methylated-DNA-[protein]-cysteine methyltransferase